MSYQDVRKNVQSLLSALDEPTSSAHAARLSREAQVATATQAARSPDKAAPSPSRSPSINNIPSSRKTNSNSPVSSVIPSQRQLDSLLSSLNARAGVGADKAQHAGASAFLGSKRRLIEPFGPVAHAQSQQREDAFDPNVFGSVVPPPSQETFGRLPSGAEAESYTTRRASAEKPTEGIGELSFAKALPIVSRLLGDEGFVIELKKMKSQQDALERRMWAKREKIKAEHQRNTQAERDIARIARRPIPPEKQAQLASALAAELDEFYRLTVLPSLDSLADRQRSSLTELGVPGLAGDLEDPRVRKRINGIMDVLQGAMDE